MGLRIDGIAGAPSAEYRLPGALPGRVLLRRGVAADYCRLARFHYRGGRPATWADVWTALHDVPGRPAVLAAVAVLSYPALGVAARRRALGLDGMDGAAQASFINANVRTISRVVVHPAYRGLGLAVALVRCVIRHCPVRYVEALSMMARVHPFFERAGMTRAGSADEGRPAYYIIDRWAAAGGGPGTVQCSSCSAAAGPMGE